MVCGMIEEFDNMNNLGPNLNAGLEMGEYKLRMNDELAICNLHLQ